MTMSWWHPPKATLRAMPSRSRSRGRDGRRLTARKRSLSRERRVVNTERKYEKSPPRRSRSRSPRRGRTRSRSSGRRETLRHNARSRSRSSERKFYRNPRSSSRSSSPRDRRGGSSPSPPSHGSGDDRNRRLEHKERKVKKAKKDKKAKKKKQDSPMRTSSASCSPDERGDNGQEGEKSDLGQSATETTVIDDAKSFFARLKEQESTKQMIGTVHASGVRPAASSSAAPSDQWECSKAGCGHKNSKYSTACSKCGAMKRMSEWR